MALRTNPKTSLVIFLAIVALPAAVAPVAQGAAEVKLQGGGEAAVDGEQLGTQIVKAGPREFTCAKALLKGTVQNGANHITVAPETSECHTPVLGITSPVTTTMNECTYTYSIHKGPDGQYTETESINCPLGQKIEKHIYSSHANHTSGTSLCTLKIGPQTNLTTTTVTNKANGAGESDDDIELNTNVAGIAYTVEPQNVTCGESGTLTHTGKATLRATRPAGTFIGMSIVGE